MTLINDILKESKERRIFCVYQRGNLKAERLNRFSLDTLGLPFLLGVGMKTRQCSWCKKILEIKHFPPKKEGCWRYKTCKKCKNKRAKEIYTKNPLPKLLSSIKHRCKNSQYYRGIKCRIKVEDLDFLWQRDKGWLLKNPSIHRLNSKRHYARSNCAFIELSENVAQANSERVNPK